MPRSEATATPVELVLEEVAEHRGGAVCGASSARWCPASILRSADMVCPV